MKKEKVNDINRKPHERTPEEKAALRAKLPEKLSKVGEMLFSDKPRKEYLIIENWKAVMR